MLYTLMPFEVLSLRKTVPSTYSVENAELDMPLHTGGKMLVRDAWKEYSYCLTIKNA